MRSDSQKGRVKQFLFLVLNRTKQRNDEKVKVVEPPKWMISTLNLVVATHIFFIFTPQNWGDDPIWRAYFWDGLVQPTSKIHPNFVLSLIPPIFCFSHDALHDRARRGPSSHPNRSLPDVFFLRRDDPTWVTWHLSRKDHPQFMNWIMIRCIEPQKYLWDSPYINHCWPLILGISLELQARLQCWRKTYVSLLWTWPSTQRIQ